MTQVERLAQALSLPLQAITDVGTPVQVVSTGTPVLFVPVRSLREVSNFRPLHLDVPTLTELCGELGLPAANVAVFTLETALPGRDVHMRFFARLRVCLKIRLPVLPAADWRPIWCTTVCCRSRRR